MAQFVARNGPEFEQMTKNKQKGNSKFQFLFGGEYYNYYQYKVNTEQTGEVFTRQRSLLSYKYLILVLKQHNLNGNSQNDWSKSVVHDNAKLEQLIQQQEALREQIKQSEQNLNAQHTVSFNFYLKSFS